jgi:hypothetical protein
MAEKSVLPSVTGKGQNNGSCLILNGSKPPLTGPDEKGPAQRMARVLVISGEQATVDSISGALKELCEMPAGPRTVSSFLGAVGLLNEHNPKILILHKGYVEKDPMAHFKLLNIAKSPSIRAMVILVRQEPDTSDSEPGGVQFDEFVVSGDIGGLRKAVARLTDEIFNDGTPCLMIDANEDKNTVVVTDAGQSQKGAATEKPEATLEKADPLPSISVKFEISKGNAPPPVADELATAETSPSEAPDPEAKKKE